ncbi:MAG TPA: hypothetical protein VMP01_13395 [Pirellulaceae bacterium]|nr:hypothetical protein [Pirellulaceae bacterium]
MSDLKRREEGVRLKHRAGQNSVKMYNKQPTLLRVETTLNDARGLKVYRRRQGDPQGKPQWRKLRKSVADLSRRCRLSQAANERYLEALATVAPDVPLSEVTDRLCQIAWQPLGSGPVSAVATPPGCRGDSHRSAPVNAVPTPLDGLPSPSKWCTRSASAPANHSRSEWTTLGINFFRGGAMELLSTTVYHA